MISAPPPGTLSPNATDPSGASIRNPVQQAGDLLGFRGYEGDQGNLPMPGAPGGPLGSWMREQGMDPVMHGYDFMGVPVQRPWLMPTTPPPANEAMNQQGGVQTASYVQPVSADGNIARMAQQVRPVADQKPASKERDNPEDMFTPQQNLDRNKAWAKPGPYNTPLSPQQERQFQKWVKDNNVNWDTNDLSYDMRGYWKAMKAGDPEAKTTINDYDKSVHYPDRWKTPYEATFSNESQYAQPTAPQWVKIGKDPEGKEMWQYRLPNGHVIYDDKQGRWFGLPSSSK